MSGVLCETVEQTRKALELWGEYVRSDVPVKKYGNTLAFHRYGRDFTKHEEEQALLVDHLVARLSKLDPAAAQAMKLIYIAELDIRHASMKLGVSYGKGQSICNAGLYWISGAICKPSAKSLELMASLGLEVLG